jgi:outer membrane protein OmpA-like peptidoglycan-associated protein
MALETTYPWQSNRRAAFRVERWSWSALGWLVVAFVLAVGFHWWLFYFFSNVDFGRNMLPTARVQERPERIAINPDVLKDQKPIQEIPDMIAPASTDPKVKADFQDIVDMLPDDRAIDLTASVDKVTNFSVPDSDPKAMAPASAPSLAAIAESLPGPDLAESMSAIKSSALDAAVSPNQLVLPGKSLEEQISGLDGKLLKDMDRKSQAGDGKQKLAGYSNLEDLIDRGGSVNASTAPIMLPTDLLFEYNSDQLAEGARLSLMKLGYLISKNPNNVFTIEGHTDTTGSEQYNFDLSQRRANAVVQFLMNSLRLGTDRIRAVGMGESRPLPNVNPNGTPEEQTLNRRVEIKIRPLR